TGEAVAISFEDDNGFLADVLDLRTRVGDDPNAHIDPNEVYKGKDAIFDYNGVTNIKRATNEFTIGGVTYNLLKADPDTEVTVRVTQDVDATVDAIKAFVDKYNEVVEKVSNKLTEKRYYDYQPLLDAQKEEMTEKEIELWEERARSGLLRGDNLLTSIASS